MARIFITGSADGLGRGNAQHLLDGGHEVVVHVRSTERLSAVQALLDRGARAVVGDLADVEATRAVADQVNALGTMDAVIHNAGVYQSPAVLEVNVVAPYLLTAWMKRPRRLIYLSSGLHRGGRPQLQGVDFRSPRATGSYSDSKLFVTALALALAARWPDVQAHAVDPGWVPTKMGGPGAPDDLILGHRTQEWLATSDDPRALLSGGYWHHQRRIEAHPAASDPAFQARLLSALAEATGVTVD